MCTYHSTLRQELVWVVVAESFQISSHCLEPLILSDASHRRCLWLAVELRLSFEDEMERK